MKKTLKKRAFISAIAMLIVSAIVLTSSTFAWFAMATKVNVDSMELNITSLDGIVFSANTTNWTTSLTSTDLTNDQSSQYRYGAYVGNNNNFPVKLSPASSSCYTVKQFPTFYGADIDDKGLLTSSLLTPSGNTKTASDKGNGYVAFDLFIKVAEDVTVTWTPTLSVNDGDVMDPIYAMRVGVVKVGKVAEKADAAAIQALVPQSTTTGDDNTTNLMTVWEYNNKKHIATAGVADGVADVTKALNSVRENYNLGTAHIMTSASYTRDLDAVYTTGTETKKQFTLASGVTNIRVYIWLEGNDVDCESAIAGSIVKCGLQFSIVG